MLDEGPSGSWPVRAVRTAPDPLSALGHAGRHRDRLSGKNQGQNGHASIKRSSIIYQSLDCLAIRASVRPGYPVNGRTAATGIGRVGAGVYW